MRLVLPDGSLQASVQDQVAGVRALARALPAVDVGDLASAELPLRKRVDVLVVLPGAMRQLERRHGHRLSAVVDDFDVLAGRTGSALHDRADVQAHAYGALVMSMQPDVSAKPFSGHARRVSG
jgi:hypothetical protein